MDWKITPKILIVSILHASDNKALPVKEMIVMGQLFDFSANTIRVATTRLVREGRIESDERGMYRLVDTSTSISRFVNSWKKGESRIKAWDGTWISCLPPRSPAAQQTKNKKALRLPGFREGLPGLWVRPNNITISLPDLKELLVDQGMDKEGEIFIGGHFNPSQTERWQGYLWPVDQLIATALAAQKRIDKSIARINSLPAEKAMVESYLVGTNTVHWLVTDPLLPQKMMSSKYRTALTKTMLKYSKIGIRIWEKEIKGLRVRAAPSHNGLQDW